MPAPPTVAASPVLVRGHERKLALLDLARALAAAWVLGAHLSIMLNRRVPFFSEGRIPVDVFIFLSGFLMFHLLGRQREKWSVEGALTFYVRRFFRIAPAFYLALLLYICFRGFYADNLARAETHFGSDGSFTSYVVPLHLSDLLTHFTFLHGLLPGRSTRVFGPAWTLSLEMQFYAVAPLVAHWLTKKPVPTLLGAFAVNAFAWCWWGSYGHIGWGPHHAFPAFLPDRIFLFCFGSAACLYHESAIRRNAWLLAGTGVGSLLIFPLDSVLLCCALTAGLLLILHVPGNGLARVLQRLAAARFTGWIAECSYSLYLVHQFCFALAAWLLWRWLEPAGAGLSTRWSYALAAITVSVGVAALIYAFIEKPARDLGKRLSGTGLALRISRLLPSGPGSAPRTL